MQYFFSHQSHLGFHPIESGSKQVKFLVSLSLFDYKGICLKFLFATFMHAFLFVQMNGKHLPAILYNPGVHGDPLHSVGELYRVKQATFNFGKDGQRRNRFETSI
jgi:hypothetical protein